MGARIWKRQPLRRGGAGRISRAGGGEERRGGERGWRKGNFWSGVSRVSRAAQSSAPAADLSTRNPGPIGFLRCPRGADERASSKQQHGDTNSLGRPGVDARGLAADPPSSSVGRSVGRRRWTRSRAPPCSSFFIGPFACTMRARCVLCVVRARRRYRIQACRFEIMNNERQFPPSSKHRLKKNTLHRRAGAEDGIFVGSCSVGACTVAAMR